MAFGNFGLLGEDSSSHSAAVSQVAYAGAEAEEKFFAGMLGGAGDGEIGFERGMQGHGSLGEAL